MHCPISLTSLDDIEFPVFIKDSPHHIYELQHLAKWFRAARTNPLTRRHITWKHIRPAKLPGRDIAKIKQHLAHEMSTARLQPTDQEQVDYMAVYRAYADNFENCFRVQANGTLRCDGEIRQIVPVWYNSQRVFIQLLVSMEPPLLVLKDPQQGDIATTNWNKTEMIRAYTHALVAYQKVCEVLRRPKSPGYTSDVQVEA